MTSAQRERFKRILAKLEEYHGPLEVRFADRVEQVLWMILLRHSSQDRALRALRTLQRHYLDYNELRVAPQTDIAEVIGGYVRGDGVAVADELRGFLRKIRERHNLVGFKFLDDLGLEEKRRALSELPGMGADAALAVLLLSQDKDEVLVADRPATNMAIQLGIVPKTTTAVRFRKTIEDNFEEHSDRVRAFLLLAAHTRVAGQEDDPLASMYIRSAKKKLAGKSRAARAVPRTARTRTTRSSTTRSGTKKSSRR